MSVLGIFVIGNVVSQVLGHRTWRGSSPWQKVTALIRYLSYRGFHVQTLRWNSAPLGMLLLAAAGTVFFFCKFTGLPRWTRRGIGTDRMLYVGRHGSDSPAILLAKFGLWRLPAVGNKIGMDGPGMYAFCLVGHSDDPTAIPPSTDFP